MKSEVTPIGEKLLFALIYLPKVSQVRWPPLNSTRTTDSSRRQRHRGGIGQPNPGGSRPSAELSPFDKDS